MLIKCNIKKNFYTVIRNITVVLHFLEIAMVSKSNEQNKLVLANSGLQCNKNESAVVVKYGLKIDEQYKLESKIMESKLLKRPTDEYHSFVLSWSPDNIVFKIDGKSNYLNASNLPLNIILDSEVKQIIYILSLLKNNLIY